MFRMWGKIMKDNRLVRDKVICIGDYSLSRTQMDSRLWMISVMSLISQNRCGWTPRSGISSCTTRPGSLRTTLSIPLILIFWRFRLLKNKL